MKKKILSLLLCIVLCLSLMPVSASAEENFSFADLPETGVTGITLSADWTDVAEDGAVIKNAFVQYCKDNNIQTDENGIALIDYVSYWGGSATYHTWIIIVQGDTVTAEDGGLSNLAAILAAVNDPNPIYDWWINGTYTAVTKYDVWVDDIQVTSDNKDNICGDEGAQATFDPETNERPFMQVQQEVSA